MLRVELIDSFNQVVRIPTSDASMNALEIVLLALLIVFPLLDIVLEKHQFKSKVLEYLKLSIMLWVVTAFLIYAFSIGALGINAPNYIPSSTLQITMAIVICVALVIYMTYSAVSISRSSDMKSQVQRALEKGAGSLNAVLPTTRSEYVVFVILVSVSAGICEELIFRWYLLYWIESHANWMIACVISSLVFGLWHLYLGWAHVAKSAAVGLLLCLLYLYFESILFVIFLHIFMDVHAGTVAFVARRPSSDASPDR
ncbi:MAG: hypothetical protein CMJ40_09820 [Phycisphaerae bacterium]|nr:hypothetical protein [Phycisphaerae bacterium]|tara:strand:+ start:325 stop:1092 length:768 start_codon:yes stop_codon:yes gene_type:complete